MVLEVVATNGSCRSLRHEVSPHVAGTVEVTGGTIDNASSCTTSRVG